MRLIPLLIMLIGTNVFADEVRYTCFPQYSENSCQPKVSFGASLDIIDGKTTVFIQKYLPGITLGIFHGVCNGSLESGLECLDNKVDGSFIARKIGRRVAATFDGDSASPEIWKCRRN